MRTPHPLFFGTQANIKEDKKWDTTVYESGTQNIEDKCIPL